MKIMRFVFSIIIYLLFIIKCQAEGFKSCDLIFIYDGNSDFSSAITETTADSDSIKFIHVGVIEIDKENNIIVWDASPERGVSSSCFEEFIKNVPLRNGKPSIVVKRLSIPFPIETTLENIKKHNGQPYDWWYLPDNGKMYCSELVYESFRDFGGDRIFSSKPMNFRSPDGTIPDFWIRLFNQLGEPVPEGIPGTNPNDLSKDNRLVSIPLSCFYYLNE